MTSPFTDALLNARLPVVMEIKPTDGHGAGLLAGRTVAELVAAYARAGAPCLSVVTGSWFGGDERLLAEAAATTRLPLLRKDFITRRSQLLRSRELGASAVLLTAGLLPRESLHRLTEECLRLGLTPFVEVTDEAEAERVPFGDRAVVAVANKDIGTRERGPGDLNRGPALLPAVRATGTPCPVSASGITTPEQGAGLLRAGFAGLLVGTGLLRAGSPEEWAAELDRLLRTPAARP
ncbi:indole-3-glycerol-phosphate synthase [Streptomyces sp. ST2-7A]|uniref:indole-3-glycerol-phosphate synthase n=1 Tax=Streptomyces sp. ST2-7A TaxID=2907214 RepID=UPI001F470A5A|nr:indole-3-glycerol-phosphate synthase [Streptomyces sp. ST2-7A]MCE7081110.1 indole-3-glycerol-phosphate synthase [Streptomyces sp. ST2-7A]